MKYLAALVLALPLLSSCNEEGYQREYVVPSNVPHVRPGYHAHREEPRQNLHHRQERRNETVVTVPAERAHGHGPTNVHSRNEHGSVEHSVSDQGRQNPKAVIEEHHS